MSLEGLGRTPKPGRARRLLSDPVRTAAFLLPAALVAVFLPLLVRAGLRTVTNSRQGRVDAGGNAIGNSTGSKVITTLPATPAALLLVTDAAGVPVTLALMAVAPSGRGGTLVVVPVGTVGASGQRLDAAYADGGLTELATQVEQTFQISLAAKGEAKPEVLGPLLSPLTPVSVTFDDAVRGAPGTADDVLRPAGAATLDGAAVAAVLAAHGADESEVARLPRTRAVWAALLSSRHDGGILTAPAVGPNGPMVTSVLEAVGALAASASTVVTLAVEPKGPTGPGEQLVADPAALRALMARVLPGAVSPVDGHLRLRLMNPSGDPAISLAATRSLVAAGANVVMIDDRKGSIPTNGSIALSDATRSAEAESYATALGRLDVQTVTTTVDGIDATVTLGAEASALTTAVTVATATVAPTVAPTTA